MPEVTDPQRRAFESLVGNPDDLEVLVIDEGSFLDVSMVHHMSRRMQQLKNNSNDHFGGVIVVVLADFHQLSSVGGVSLHRAAVSSELPDEALRELGMLKKEKGHEVGKLSDNGADRKGAAIMKLLTRYELTEQMRAADDLEHAANLFHMRDTHSVQPVSERLLSSLQPLTSEAIAAHGEALRFAPIGALSLREGDVLSLMQAREFARFHNRPLFFWKRQLTGQNASWLSDEEEDLVYLHEKAGVCGFFVAGAPAIVLNNISIGNCVVNGANGRMHSLTLNDEHDIGTFIETAEHDLRLVLQQSGAVWDGLLEVEIPVPHSINIVPSDLKESIKAHLIKEKISLSETELVLPILIGSRPAVYTLTSVEAAQACTPKTINLRKHDVDLAFLVTDFKLQGSTHDYLILSLGYRDFSPYMSLTSLYVLLSRARLSKNIFVIGVDFTDPHALDHLRVLLHPPVLQIWQTGYDDVGCWDSSRIQAAAAVALNKIAEETIAKKALRLQRQTKTGTT